MHFPTWTLSPDCSSLAAAGMQGTEQFGHAKNIQAQFIIPF